MSASGDRHCATCSCGRRAPLQGSHKLKRGPGTIAWGEHLEVWHAYAAKFGSAQSPERMAERGGFSWGEVVMLLGRDPGTWAAR